MSKSPPGISKFLRRKRATPGKVKDAGPAAPVSWFEIPALDADRAIRFYDHIFGITMMRQEGNGYVMGFFPSAAGTGGAVVQGEGCAPGGIGPLLYLNAGDDLAPVLARVEEAGGRVIMGKTPISPEAGCFALFLDTEGNRLALHSKA